VEGELILSLAYFSFVCLLYYNAVVIAIGYGLDGRGVGVRIPIGAGFSPSYPMVPGALSSGVTRPGCEAEHSYPTSGIPRIHVGRPLDR
jgi:hypothetical protein